MPENQEPNLIHSLIERIDNLTQFIVDIRGEMYKRSDFSNDSTRIYDQIALAQTHMLSALKDAVSTIDRQIDNCITRGELGLFELRVKDMVPRSEHEARWQNDSLRFTKLEQSYMALRTLLEQINKKTIHPLVVASVGAILGGLGTSMVGTYIQGLIHPITQVVK